jgi:hypothetical protein
VEFIFVRFGIFSLTVLFSLRGILFIAVTSFLNTTEPKPAISLFIKIALKGTLKLLSMTTDFGMSQGVNIKLNFGVGNTAKSVVVLHVVVRCFENGLVDSLD